MSWEVFEEICNKIGTKQVSLQGEGEPTLWPHFKQAVKYLRAKGHLVSTITNGSTTRHIDLIEDLHGVYISIDTLDEEEASSLGRHNLAKVLENLKPLIPHKKKIIITTVNYGQSFLAVKEYVNSLGFMWQCQPLQQKPDYTKVYPVHWVKPLKSIPVKSLKCRYLESTLLDFYNIDGLHRPCCFIKSSEIIDPLELQRKLNVGTVPHSCSGCSKIEGV